MNKIINSSLSYFRSNKAIRIILIYSIISLLWIFFSDELVFKLFSNVATQRSLSIFKGSLFVIITSLLLYKLINNAIQEVVRTEKKLRESEQYSRMLFETSSIGLALTKHDGKFVDVNPAYAKIIGRTIEETLKLDYWEITPKIYNSQEQKQLENLSKTGYYGPYEKEYIHKDGHYVPVRLQGSIIERNGEKYIWSSVEDITEDRLKDFLLRESENRLRFALESTNDGLWDVQMKTGEVYISPRGCEILGYNNDETDKVAKIWSELVHPDDLQITKERLNDHLEGRSEIFDVEQRLKMKSGDWVWVRTRGKVVARDTDGNPLRMTGTHTNISKRKRAEEVIKQSEANLNSLINNKEESIWSIDNEYNYITFNIFFSKAYLKAFNVELKKGMNAIEVLTPELRSFWKPKYDAALSGQRIIFEFSAQVGSKLHSYEVYLNPIVSDDRITGASALSVDITARKEVEDALRASEERYRTIFESARDVIYTISSEGIITSINPAFETLTGWSVNEWLDKPFGSLVHPEDLPKALEAFRKVMAGEKIEAYEIRILSKSGEYKIGEFTPSPLVIGNKTIATIGIARDITERKHTEEALRESEEKFRTLTETTSAAIFIFKGEFFRYLNSFAEQITGYKNVELLNKNFWEIVHPDYRNLIKERGLSRQRGELVPQRYEFKILTKTGEERWLDFTAGLINFEGVPAGIGTAIDITENKRAEALLIASKEQMRSLAAHLQTIREEERASIAREMHDELGQILTSLKMNITFTRKELEENKLNEKKEKFLEELSSMNLTVDKAVTQVRKLITQLRPELIDKLGLIAALEWYAEEYQKTTKIKCEFKTDQEELTLNHDADLAIFRIVQEALTNVAKHSKAKSVKICLNKTEDKLSLEITDDGRGILEEELEGKKSFGLMGMRERASLIGGKLEICRAGEKGTVVRLVVEHK